MLEAPHPVSLERGGLSDQKCMELGACGEWHGALRDLKNIGALPRSDDAWRLRTRCGLADPTLTPLRPPTSARPLGKGGAAGPQALTVRHGARRPR